MYLSRAIDMLRSNGIDIPEEYIQHISPLGWGRIVLKGDYVWNLKQNKKNNKNHRILNIQEIGDFHLKNALTYNFLFLVVSVL
nr:Tn3 family transposase [Bacillus cereus]